MIARFQLFSFLDTIYVEATEIGIRVHSEDPTVEVIRKETWHEGLLGVSGAWKIAVQIEQLTELGLGTNERSGFLLPYEQYDSAVSSDLDLVSGWVQACPYLLKIDRQS